VLFVCLSREIVIFTQQQLTFATKIIFVKNPLLLNFPRALPERLLHFDVAYKYCLVENQLDIAEWCAHIMDAIFKINRAKYFVITAIHFFKRNHTLADIPFSFVPDKKAHIVTIIPQTTQRCSLDGKPFTQTCAVVSGPKSNPLQIVADACFVVSCQKCKAWDI
jgi:hypothetical protein